MSQVQTNIVLGGRGAHSRRSGLNADKTIVFQTFKKVSQGLLASIVLISRSLTENGEV